MIVSYSNLRCTSPPTASFSRDTLRVSHWQCSASPPICQLWCKRICLPLRTKCRMTAMIVWKSRSKSKSPMSLLIVMSQWKVIQVRCQRATSSTIIQTPNTLSSRKRCTRCRPVRRLPEFVLHRRTTICRHRKAAHPLLHMREQTNTRSLIMGVHRGTRCRDRIQSHQVGIRAKINWMNCLQSHTTTAAAEADAIQVQNVNVIL